MQLKLIHVSFLPRKTVKNQLKKVAHWKGPERDGLQEHELKYFTNLHDRIADQFNIVMETGGVPRWMKYGRTVLCMKNPTLGKAAVSYKPITCLPLMCSGTLAETIYWHPDSEQLFRKTKGLS